MGDPKLTYVKYHNFFYSGLNFKNYRFIAYTFLIKTWLCQCIILQSDNKHAMIGRIPSQVFTPIA